MGDIRSPLYRHAGGAMLRAAVLPLPQSPMRWPELSDPGSCRMWLREVWSLPGFAEAVRYASDSLVGEVEAVVDGAVTERRRVRRVTLSVVRYLSRAVGRPTPFGLFAGVAPVEVGGEPRAVWGAEHRLLVRADTLWLDDVIERLEADPAVLRQLDVVFSDLVVVRGGRVEVPRGAGRVTMRDAAAVRLIRRIAARPVSWQVLWDKVADAFPDAQPSIIDGVLGKLVDNGLLLTSLRAPMTEPDPLAHLVDVLSRVSVASAVAVVGQVHDIRRIIQTHNATGTPGQERVRLRAAAGERMRRLSPAGRTTLAGDLHLDCQITIPTDLAEQMTSAATTLLRLTRQPRPDPAWNDWCQRFCDRYGTGAVVPVGEAVHPDAGLGWPAGYPTSMLAAPEDRITRRDEELLALAWQAVIGEERELILTDELVSAITAEEPVHPRWIPAHVELGARVHAASVKALRTGDYTFTVHPAQAFGTLTSRFESAVARAGLATTFAATPVAVAGALPAQMSFPPLFAHSENVARLTRYLPHVLSLGEHRYGDDASVISVDDLGIVAVADGLHLVSISGRRVVEPQVFHALALEKQAPPLARFLAMMARGFLARYTEFDWGPAAARLPFLPRVRYRRAILSPATWHLTTDLADGNSWDQALAGWRRRWQCPNLVELHDDHRSLRLDLTVTAHRAVLRQHLDRHGRARLTETAATAQTGWIGGHAHEIVLPFARVTPPAPNLVTGPLPLVKNATGAHLLAAPGSSWLYAKVFTHPESLDELVRVYLPRLLDMLDGEPAYWFVRYRGVRETDHLRLRIRVNDEDGYAAAAKAVGRWGQKLAEAGVASQVTLASYFPEIGRYGPGPAMNAAEAVFVADSHVVAVAMRHLSPQVVIHPVALAAADMVDFVDGFHTSLEAATGWLLEHLATKPGPPVEQTIASQAATWASHRTLPDGSALPIPVAEAWQARRVALAAFRQELPDNAFTDHVLSALLHMHHNRARLIDREDEAHCRRLARQIALTRRAHTASRS